MHQAPFDDTDGAWQRRGSCPLKLLFTHAAIRVKTVINDGNVTPRGTQVSYALTDMMDRLGVLHGRTTKAWHRLERHKNKDTENIYSHLKEPLTGSSHRSSNGLHRKIRWLVDPVGILRRVGVSLERHRPMCWTRQSP